MAKKKLKKIPKGETRFLEKNRPEKKKGTSYMLKEKPFETLRHGEASQFQGFKDLDKGLETLGKFPKAFI